MPYAVRMLCHFLGDVVSWTLGSRLAYAESGDRARADGMLGQLTRKLATEPSLATALTQGPRPRSISSTPAASPSPTRAPSARAA